jgi:hypothetical protein
MQTNCASKPSPEWIQDFSTAMSGGSAKNKNKKKELDASIFSTAIFGLFKCHFPS